MHDACQCRFQHVTCNSCGKKGHISQACRSKPTSQQTKSHVKLSVHSTEAAIPEEEPTEYYLYPVQDAKHSPLQTEVYINDKPVVDTGAAVSIITMHQLADISLPQKSPVLQPINSSYALHIYRVGNSSSRYSTLTVKVRLHQQEFSLPLIGGRFRS